LAQNWVKDGREGHIHPQHTQDISYFGTFGSMDRKGGGEGIIGGIPGVTIVLSGLGDCMYVEYMINQFG